MVSTAVDQFGQPVPESHWNAPTDLRNRAGRRADASMMRKLPAARRAQLHQLLANGWLIGRGWGRKQRAGLF